MKILLFGATGRTGKLILQKAVQAGHEVTAIARNPSQLAGMNAKIVQGTPYDRKTVSEAIAGCDAVISTLNVSRISDNPWAKLRSPQNLISQSINNALEEMKTSGIKRIIVMSALGAGESKKKMPFVFNLFISLTNLKYAFNDHTRQENLLAGSDSNWTVIRLPMLTDTPDEKEIIVNRNDNTKLNRNINRESVASFIVSILDNKTYFKSAVAISNK